MRAHSVAYVELLTLCRIRTKNVRRVTQKVTVIRTAHRTKYSTRYRWTNQNLNHCQQQLRSATHMVTDLTGTSSQSLGHFTTDGRLVSQSVRPGVEPLLRLITRFLFSFVRRALSLKTVGLSTPNLSLSYSDAFHSPVPAETAQKILVPGDSWGSFVLQQRVNIINSTVL
jgi:hypothetical protein